jgi:hypothetical protein
VQIWRNDTMEGSAWAGGKNLSKPRDLWKFKHITSTIVSFPKDPSVRYCVGSCWTTYSWKDLTEIYPKITLQINISSKKNVVLCQLAIWTRNNYKSKYNNPNNTDISISTHHIDRKGFSCTISQENIPIF